MSKSKDSGMSKWLIFPVMLLTAIVIYPMHAEAIGTAAGTNITNQATVNYQDASANNYSANSNTVTTTVNAVYAVAVNAPVDMSSAPNTRVYYAYTVTNNSNTSDTFALSAASGAGGNTWNITLYADDGAGGGVANDGIHQAGETNVTNSTGALAADATYYFFAAVDIPAGTASGQADDTVLSVVGSGDPGAGDDTSDTVTTTCIGPVLGVTKQVRNVSTAGAFGNNANADPGHTLEYQLAVTNSGSASATSVVLTDAINANTTFVAGSIWTGSNGAAFNGAGNTNVDDDNTQEGGETCAVDACGQASISGATISAYLGNGANETTGGSLGIGSTVYIYFRVTVN
jgi:uncharacterized repeat protein (TIGR01451 family)